MEILVSQGVPGMVGLVGLVACAIMAVVFAVKKNPSASTSWIFCGVLFAVLLIGVALFGLRMASEPAGRSSAALEAVMAINAEAAILYSRIVAGTLGVALILNIIFLKGRRIAVNLLLLVSVVAVAVAVPMLVQLYMPIP